MSSQDMNAARARLALNASEVEVARLLRVSTVNDRNAGNG